jgi:hypothetical protein
MSSEQNKTTAGEDKVVQPPASAVASAAAETPGVRLGWQAFTARYFPGRGRHDFKVLKAYEAYRNGSPAAEWLPSEGGEPSEALQVWEGGGGAVPAGSKEKARGNGPFLLR